MSTGFDSRSSRLTTFDKVLYSIATLFIVLILLSFGASWLANRVPHRPKTVANNATFLWAPAVGFPGGLPRRGWWMSCRQNNGQDWCRLSDINGHTEYEGEFLPYPKTAPIPDAELVIDGEKTSETKLWVGNALVPIVFLKNKRALIPASMYEKGSQLLGEMKSGS